MVDISEQSIVTGGGGGVLYYYDQGRARTITGPDLSCKQPTGSVSVGLVVGQQGRGQAGVGGVVRDTVLGVEKTLGVCRVDERRRTSVEDALGGRHLESSLESGGHDEGGTSQSSALSDHGGLRGHGGLQGLVGHLQSRGPLGLQTSCNGTILLYFSPRHNVCTYVKNFYWKNLCMFHL